MPDPFVTRPRAQSPLPPAWTAPIDAFVEYRIAGGAMPGTIRINLHYLRLLARRVADPWTATLDDVVRFLANPDWQAETRKSARAAVRAFYGWATVAGRIERDPSLRLPRIRTAPGQPRPAPTEALVQAMEIADTAMRDRRALSLKRRWLMLLLARAGLTNTEIGLAHTDQFVDGHMEVRRRNGLVHVVDPELGTIARSLPEGFLLPGEDGGPLDADTVRWNLAKLIGSPCPWAERPARAEAALAAVRKRIRVPTRGENARLMLMLAAFAGLRRAEIARVHSRDLVDGNLRVIGKGGRVRTIPVGPVLLETLTAAIASRPEGYLFPGRHDGHLAPASVGVIMSNLLGGTWTPHTLRHRFATHAYAAERDLLAVQQLLGHSKPETTARYAAVPGHALGRAVAAAESLG